MSRNQIPKKFITSGKIEAYLKQNNIAVVHFVREAKVLNYASFKVGIEHTQDKNRAEELGMTSAGHYILHLMKIGQDVMKVEDIFVVDFVNRSV